METNKIIKKSIPIINETSKKFRLIIPREVSLKKNYLCQVIPSVEWSGLLFYTMEGDVDDVDNMIITLKDIHPMDKGTGGATSYILDASTVVDLFQDKADLMDYRLGHCHSHNSMPTFFSGTDNEELTDNAPNHNGYLSVIVNNKGDIVAKIAFMGKSEKVVSKKVSMKSVAGKLLEWVFPSQEEEDVVITVDAIIEEENPDRVTDEIFLSKVSELLTPAKTTKKLTSSIWQAGYTYNFVTKLYEKEEQEPYQRNLPVYNKSERSFTKPQVTKAKRLGGKTTATQNWWTDTDAEKFLMLLLSNGTIDSIPEDDSLWGKLQEYEEQALLIEPNLKVFIEDWLDPYIYNVMDNFCDGYFNPLLPNDNSKMKVLYFKAIGLLERFKKNSDLAKELMTYLKEFIATEFIEAK